MARKRKSLASEPENGALPSSSLAEPVEVPFKIKVSPTATTKRRKSSSGKKLAGDDYEQYRSSFGTALDLYYKVTPAAANTIEKNEPKTEWRSERMKKYANIQLGDDSDVKFKVGDVIEVNSDSTDYDLPLTHSIVQILECRALSAHHVYLRVVWLYRPEDLGRMGGRKPYHASNEVIPSNHMDMIDATAINSTAIKLIHLDDTYADKEPIPENAVIYRQLYNPYTQTLTPTPAICICDQPYNPERGTIVCDNKSCRRRMHEECVKNGLRSRIYRIEALQEAADDETHDPETNGVPASVIKKEDVGHTDDAKDNKPADGKTSFLSSFTKLSKNLLHLGGSRPQSETGLPSPDASEANGENLEPRDDLRGPQLLPEGLLEKARQHISVEFEDAEDSTCTVVVKLPGKPKKTRKEKPRCLYCNAPV